MSAKKRAKFAMVIFFVLDDVIEDSDRAIIAQFLQLATVVRDVPAFFDLEAAKSHANAAGAVGQRIGLSARRAVICRFGTTEFDHPPLPKSSMLPFGRGEVAQNLGANRVIVAIGEGVVGVVALHFGLPVGLEGSKNFL